MHDPKPVASLHEGGVLVGVVDANDVGVLEEVVHTSS